jgi:hypothetical protein
MVLDAAAPCSLNAVNTTLCVFNVNNDGDLAPTTVYLLSTTNFQGTARLLNTTMFAQTFYDATINGGEVSLESIHINPSLNGSVVNGGALHLVNLSASTSGNAPYNVTFGPNAGLPQKTNEFIGAFAYNGCTYNNFNPANPANVWMDFALSRYAVLDNSRPQFPRHVPCRHRHQQHRRETRWRHPDQSDLRRRFKLLERLLPKCFVKRRPHGCHHRDR